MGIIFVNTNEFDKNSNCTIHKTGKLGFNTNAAKKLKIHVNTYIKIGYKDEDKKLDNLYMVVLPGEKEGVYKVNKAGKYFYINTKAFFDKMEIDYFKNTIVYDISDHEEDKVKMYRLQRKDKKKKKIASTN